MRKIFHLCMDIKGALRWPDSHLRKIVNDEGNTKSGAYVRDWLRLQLHQGKKVIPVGEICEGFSFQTGCPGHPAPEESATHPPAASQEEKGGVK